MADDDTLAQTMGRLRELTESGVIADPDLAVRILEVLDDGVIIIDEGGTIRYANAQVELQFGYRRSDLVGQSIDMLLPAPVRGMHADHRTRFFADPRARPMGAGRALRGLQKNGNEIGFEISLSPIVTGQGVYAVAVIRKQRIHGTAEQPT